MTERRYTAAIVGATGLVGAEIVNALHERQFPLAALQCYASDRSAGGTTGDRAVEVELLDRANFDGTDLVFFAATERVVAEWISRATSAGATAIDLSQLHAGDPDVPLVMPAVNAATLAGYAERGIVAVPSPIALQLAGVLESLRAAAGLKRVVVSTYEPVSEAGRAGVEELSQQAVALLSGGDVEVQTFPQRIAFSVLPQVGEFLAGGYTRAEQQLINQTRRVLNDPDLAITATCVRVPLFYGSSQSVNVQTAEPLSAADARTVLGRAPGMLVEDDVSAGLYPSPLTAVGRDATIVGRIRDDESAEHAINLWLSGDNVRCAALTAVVIAEMLIRDHF
ncbi:MAG TPA: aspartate-semialdehyde dehydrogenase [Candidatus Binatia bacterium]|nr:aspartate-semialdehyde dehydrogenase [Candidatus Binatia bacterium]